VPHPPVIVPAVGHGREREASATIAAYEEVARRIAALTPDTLVISSPHSVMYTDYLHVSPGADARGDLSQFDAAGERVDLPYDTEFVRELCRRAQDAGIAAGTEGERDASLDHATMVPLHFILERYQDFSLVRMGLSGLGPMAHYRMGQQVAATAEALGRRVVYVASGDLSHKASEASSYGFAPEGPEFDEMIGHVFSTGDFLPLLTVDPGMAERAAECGLRSFQIMAGALDRTPVSAELLSLEAPFGIGYGTAAFLPTGPAGSDDSRDFGEQYLAWHEADMERRHAAEDGYVALARATVEGFVRDGREPELAGADGLLARLDGTTRGELERTRAGAFVSIKENGELRGCIGTIAPTCADLAEEIRDNAVSACSRDPRFPPITPDELGDLVISVDVLGEAEPVSDLSRLDPARYGVIVTDGGRRGLLLPDLDGVDTVEDQVRIAARKGGIDLGSNRWTLERFEVVRHT
jgi:AmmeMemoRadiSam system protein A